MLADPLAVELMSSSIPARLAYLAVDSTPRVVPVGFHWTGRDLVVATAPSAPKVAALRRNPHVALTIDTEGQPPHVLLVRGTVTLEVVEGVPPEYLAASHKVIPTRPWEAFEAQVRGLYDEMVRITIEPDVGQGARLRDEGTHLPRAAGRGQALTSAVSPASTPAWQHRAMAFTVLLCTDGSDLAEARRWRPAWPWCGPPTGSCWRPSWSRPIPRWSWARGWPAG